MHQNQNKNTNNHTPVLLEEVLTYLDPKKGEAYLDLTAGYGGHAEEVLRRTQATNAAVLVDRDEQAVVHLKQKFAEALPEIRHMDFYGASRQLNQEKRTFDCILADLGLSSPHLDKASRGFSIRSDAPLDMRMDQRQTLSAELVLNTYGEEELADILHQYGEEPKARAIARRIVAKRPLHTTKGLADIASSVWPGRSKQHPAIRTFQAIRIAVNDEIEQLRAALPEWINMLKPGGRIVVISFHSLEDRVVKQVFAEHSKHSYEADLKLLTKRPVTARHHEIVFNPRARSAKLRAAAKIKNKQKSEA
ncbi:MAG: 16S rRNA (cytosine(1402)-N(4))-methyltransferase RsmH [Actinobacteria bacterium]|nr:16S rRNA (cytosine(1402)-N(4))-methyltransferase RsmH [Actinomycetota bacterium]